MRAKLLYNCNKRELLLAYVGSLLFLFFQAVGFYLTVSEGLSFKALLLALLAAALIAFPAAWLLVRALNSAALRKVLICKSTHKKLSFFFIFIAILCLWLPAFLAFYPGISAYDTKFQLPHFFDGELTTHFPLIHTLLMGKIISIGYSLTGSYNVGMALYCFSQLFVLALVTAYGIYMLQSLRVPRWLIFLISSFYALFPLFPLMGISSTKDVYFAAFFMLAMILLIKMLERRSKTMTAVIVAAVLALSMLFRNNAVYAAAAALLIQLLSLFWCKNRRFVLRLSAAVLAAIIAAQAGFAFLQKRTNAGNGSVAEMLSVPCQQLARTYNFRYHDLTDEDHDTLTHFIRFSALPNYMPTLADPIKGNLFTEIFKEAPMDFFRFWARLGARFPLVYAEAFLYNTMPLWYVADRSILTVKDAYLEMDFYEMDYLMSQDSKLPSLESFYRELMGEGKILDIPVLSLLAVMAVYTWLLFAAFLMLIAKRKYECLILALLPLTYLATLLLGPCILPRYCLASIMCTPLVLAYLVHLANKNTAK